MSEDNRNYRVRMVRERQPYLRSVPGRWTVELEGWGPPPEVGEGLIPRGFYSEDRERVETVEAD